MPEIALKLVQGSDQAPLRSDSYVNVDSIVSAEQHIDDLLAGTHGLSKASTFAVNSITVQVNSTLVDIDEVWMDLLSAATNRQRVS